jgi:hypothetical protein
LWIYVKDDEAPFVIDENALEEVRRQQSIKFFGRESWSQAWNPVQQSEPHPWPRGASR